MTDNPFSIRFSCLELALKSSIDPENVLLTATKYYNFVNGDFTSIPELSDKVKLVQRENSPNLSKVSVQIRDTGYETTVLERIRKAPERKIFAIDLEDKSPEDIVEALEEYKSKFETLIELKAMKKLAGVSEDIDLDALSPTDDSPTLCEFNRAEVLEMKNLRNLVADESTAENEELANAITKLKASINYKPKFGGKITNPIETLFRAADTKIAEVAEDGESINATLQYAVDKAINEAARVLIVAKVDQIMVPMSVILALDHAALGTKSINPDNGMAMFSFLSGGYVEIRESVDPETENLAPYDYLVMRGTMGSQSPKDYNGRTIYLVRDASPRA